MKHSRELMLFGLENTVIGLRNDQKNFNLLHRFPTDELSRNENGVIIYD